MDKTDATFIKRVRRLYPHVEAGTLLAYRDRLTSSARLLALTGENKQRLDLVLLALFDVLIDPWARLLEKGAVRIGRHAVGGFAIGADADAINRTVDKLDELGSELRRLFNSRPLAHGRVTFAEMQTRIWLHAARENIEQQAAALAMLVQPTVAWRPPKHRFVYVLERVLTHDPDLGRSARRRLIAEIASDFIPAPERHADSLQPCAWTPEDVSNILRHLKPIGGRLKLPPPFVPVQVLWEHSARALRRREKRTTPAVKTAWRQMGPLAEARGFLIGVAKGSRGRPPPVHQRLRGYRWPTVVPLLPVPAMRLEDLASGDSSPSAGNKVPI